MAYPIWERGGYKREGGDNLEKGKMQLRKGMIRFFNGDDTWKKGRIQLGMR